MVLGFQRLAGLRFSLLSSHSPLRAAAASVMAPPRALALSVAMHAKAAVPTEEEVEFSVWGLGFRGRSGCFGRSGDDRSVGGS